MTDYAFTFNGLTFGGVGADVQVLGVTGLEDLPELRTADEARGNTDGEFSGQDLLGGRTVVVDFEVVFAAGGPAYRAVLERIKTAFVPQPAGCLPLQFTLPGLPTRRLGARCRRRQLPIDLGYDRGVARGAVEFRAADPRIYDDNASSTVLTVPANNAGRTYDRVYALTYGGGTSGTQVAVNNGTTRTSPVITITGPVDTPTVENVTAGKFLKFNLTLAVGETLTIDTDARSVVLNGTASRRSAMSVDSAWWALGPGPSTLRFSAAASTTATATVAFRSAYL